MISGIQFFIACITGTTRSTKTSSNIARTGIAYFVVFRKNSKANEMALFTCLHDTGIDEECVMIQGLKQVVKETKFIFSYFKRTQR